MFPCFMSFQVIAVYNGESRKIINDYFDSPVVHLRKAHTYGFRFPFFVRANSAIAGHARTDDVLTAT